MENELIGKWRGRLKFVLTLRSYSYASADTNTPYFCSFPVLLSPPFGNRKYIIEIKII